MIEWNLYGKLLRKMDELSYGMPKSFLLMDRMFVMSIWSREDARDWLNMEDGYQTPAMYAEKNGISVSSAMEKLDRMAARGQIFRRHTRENYDIFEYDRHPFALGFMEWQIKNPKNSWFYSLSLYIISSKLGNRMSQTTPFYRTIPMHKEYVEGSVVEPYEDLEAILDRHTRFAVADCMCRTLDKVKPDNPCHHPIETCIMTDDYAVFYIEMGLGREISKEETLAILREGEKDGRIINVTNSKDGENICSCCECGCGMLYLKKHFPGPSKDFWANYYSYVNTEKCIACGACVKKCPFNILSIVPGEENNGRGTIAVNTPDCLGCGLCVSACKNDAIHLHKKDADRFYVCPDTYEEAVGEWTKITKKDYDAFK